MKGEFKMLASMMLSFAASWILMGLIIVVSKKTLSPDDHYIGMVFLTISFWLYCLAYRLSK